MTSFVKDPENAAAPAAPGAPARPQPVALEVPVIVNGARAVEGSDKREPFSEHSQTVLVFGHGAVIRVSASLAPGQLIFLTNEKTKKEVVCQVVKSKTDGNSVGYVELRFTEPAPGFWGMRFPSDTVLPQAAPRPAGPPVAPAPPKAAPTAPPVPPSTPVASAPPNAPFAPKPIAPPPPIALKPVIPEPPAAPPLVPATPAVPSVQQRNPHSHASIFETPSAPPVASVPLITPVEVKPAIPSPPLPASSSTPTTEELKQQAARLQEQLSSILFAEPPKPAAADPLAAPASQSTVNLSEVAKQVFDTASPAAESAPVTTTKSVPPPAKLTSPSLAEEELKIPSWLAPLTRETDSTPSAASPVQVEPAAQVAEPLAPAPAEEVMLPLLEEPTRRPETAVFGGQLLGEAGPAPEASSKSRTGLFIGIAAALLLVAGGFWYSQQPGNAISAMLGGTSSAAHSPSVAAQPPAPSVAPSAQPSARIPSAAASPAPVAAPVNPPAEAPAVSAPVAHTPPSFSNSTNFTSTPVIHTLPVVPNSKAVARATPQVAEEPKKPSLGEVHLATPKINNAGTASAPGAAEPSIDVNQAANLSEPVGAISTPNQPGPVAPVPMGGDVKAAKLIKSVPPVYPDMARSQRVSGNVQIDALIEEDGSVGTMKILSGPPLLHQAALNALKQWKFQPAELDGKPTSMHLTVTVQFRTQ